MRLFVALDLPEPCAGAWAVGEVAARRPIRLWRAVKAESMHVTLCFLGWVDVASVDAVAASCGVVRGMTGASLRVGRGIWLPARRPRVLAVELCDVEGRLGAVQARLSDALAEGGWYTPEKRRFLPHATVARVGRGARVSVRSELPTLPSDLALRASTVTLFRSHLSSAGARYEGLASVETSTAQ